MAGNRLASRAPVPGWLPLLGWADGREWWPPGAGRWTPPTSNGSCSTSKCNDEVTARLRAEASTSAAFLLRHAEIRAALAVSFDALTPRKGYVDDRNDKPWRVRMVFSRELRERVARGEVTGSIRLSSWPQVKVGGHYRTAGVVIEVDSLEVLPFTTVTDGDVAASGERDREALRDRAAHCGPIRDDALVHRVEFHVV